MTPMERAVEMLNGVLQRKMNSLATYLAEASPYVAKTDRPILEAIQELNASERLHAEEAARLILLFEGVPQSGIYDPSVVESNYLSVRYLLGPLLARLEDDIALFEEYRDQCDLPEVKELLAQVIEDDSAHRERLRNLCKIT